MAKIEKLKSGTYRIRVYLGKDPSGKKIVKSFTDPDKKKLQRIAAEYADQHREVLARSVLSDAIDDYIKAKNDLLSPKTISGYKSLERTLKEKHAKFCALKIENINRKNMTDFINDLIKTGVTPKTVRNYVGLISAVLKYNGYHPPVVTLPKKQRHKMAIPEESTIKQIMAAAPDEMQIPIALAVLGLRRSEICALTSDDLEGNILHIHSAVVYNSDNKLVRKETKTDESDRFIQIPASIAKRIRQQGYVTELTPSQVSYRFEKILRKNNIQHFRLHDMRHFFASYCHTVLKLSDAQIQKLGGWKTDHVMKEYYRSSMNDKQAGMLVANSLAKLM